MNQVPEKPYILQTPEDQKRIDEAIREGRAQCYCDDGLRQVNAHEPSHNGVTYYIKEPELLASVGTPVVVDGSCLMWYAGVRNGHHGVVQRNQDLKNEQYFEYKNKGEIEPLLPPGVDVWVARDKSGCLRCGRSKLGRGVDFWHNCEHYLPADFCPDLTWEDEPRRYRMHLIPVEGDE